MPPMKSSKAKVKEFIQLRKGLPPIDMKVLQKFCRAPVSWFKKFGEYEQTPSGPLIYQDNGSDVLAVAHLDSVEKARHFSITKLSHDTWINCPTIDNRAGAFTIAHQLPQMDIVPDILLTTGEERCMSSALYFKPPRGKIYNWMFSFDRGGEDAVLYQYFDWEMKGLLERAGFKVGHGSYSDIVELEDLRIKGMNLGIGMEAYHSLNARMSLNIYLRNLKKFMRFYKENFNKHYPHLPKYNIWTPEDGFGLLHKPGSVPYQDTFTEAEIELIEDFDYEGIQLGSRITPVDIKEAVEHREMIANHKPITKDPSLFDDDGKKIIVPSKEKEISKEKSSGIKVGGEIPIPLDDTFSIVPSEDDPKGSLAQVRKPGETVRVILSESGDIDKAITLAEQEESKGKQTIGPSINPNQEDVGICDICGSENGNPCLKCIVEDADQKSEIKEKPKGRIVNLIPLGRVNDEDNEYEYTQDESGKWRWKIREPKRIKVEEAVF